MGKGRKRKPTALKIRDGSRIRDPERIEPQPRPGEPTCPEDVRGDAVAWAKWCELVVTLDDMGLLTLAEANLLANFSRVWSHACRAKKEIDEQGLTIISETKFGTSTKRNPACADYAWAVKEMTRMMPELGLTPAGRAKLSAAPKEDESPLAKLAALG